MSEDTATAEAPVEQTPEERKAEREERFKRVAQRRANAALNEIEKLMRTANRNGGYEFTEEQSEQIVGLLRAAVDKLEAAYAGARGEKARVEL
jgi:hypothetical protein